MNAYILLALVLTLVVAIMGFVFISYGTIGQVIVMFSGTGAIITAIIIIVVVKKLYPNLYPIVVRTYEERFDSFEAKDTRAKKVKDKKGYLWLETPSGKKFKMPSREFVIKGKDPHIDLFDSGEQQFPIRILKENLEEIKKKIMPEDQRVFLVDQAIPHVTEATREPGQNWMQIAQFIGIASLAIMVLVGMMFAPDYWFKSAEFWKAQIASVKAENQQLLQSGSIVCDCSGSGGSKPTPEQPPG